MTLIGTILGIFLSVIIALAAIAARGDEYQQQKYQNDSGVTIGYAVRTGLDRDKVYAKDASGRTLGWYVPSRNTTFDANGRNIGTGDYLSALIRKAESHH